MPQSNVPKKMSPVVCADFTSSDSLSFTGLVCIQDQHSIRPSEHLLPTTRGKGSPGMRQQEQEFEFSRSNASSIIGSPNHFPAGKKLPDGQLAAKTAGRKSLGQKLFSSFATPCRDCRTLEPNRPVNTNILQ